MLHGQSSDTDSDICYRLAEERRRRQRHIGQAIAALLIALLGASLVWIGLPHYQQLDAEQQQEAIFFIMIGGGVLLAIIGCVVATGRSKH